MNDCILDKSIIYIDSANAIWNSESVQNFYIDILEPIKNALYISIINATILLTPTSQLNGNVIKDGDQVYINLNEYDRISTNINNSMVRYFEKIPLNLTDKYELIYLQNANGLPAEFSFSTNYVTSCNINDSHTYVLNPVEPNLKRFNIQIYDKNNKIINKSDIIRFSMTICVYYNRKKLTMG